MRNDIWSPRLMLDGGIDYDLYRDTARTLRRAARKRVIKRALVAVRRAFVSFWNIPVLGRGGPC